MLKKIFELPSILSTVLDNMEKIQEQSEIKNIINGKRWKDIVKNYPENSVIIPLDLYTDDFETGNALGSNAGTHKITAYYVSIPTFPQHLLSGTEYIFEVLLHPSRLKHEEHKFCIERLLEILKELEDSGVKINVEGSETTVYFVLARIIGDNLGLNEILGFCTSFNAMKFCRLCTLNKTQTKENVQPSEDDFRSIEEYDLDLVKNDSKTTGIRDKCEFNELKNFHCTKNIVCDLMHDLFEGIVKCDVPMLLRKIVEDKEIPNITLDVINNIKQNFNYGTIEIGNLSLPISDAHFKKNTLKMSASEVKTFLYFLPLMLGPMIPQNNKYWLLILQLVDIADLALSASFNENLLNKLKDSIQNYTSSYKEIFGNILKPKHHFISHYIHCIEYNGPLRYVYTWFNFFISFISVFLFYSFMMTFSYESKNRIVKNYAYVCKQRKNLAKSLSYKSAMRFNNFLRMHQKGFMKSTFHYKEKNISLELFSEKKYFESFDVNYEGQEIYVCKKICHKKTDYDVGSFIVDNITNPERLFKILDIIHLTNDYYLILENYCIEKYVEHLRSYKVGESNRTFQTINVNHVTSLPFNLQKISNGEFYFRLKQI